jgi:hypothetical protein
VVPNNDCVHHPDNGHEIERLMVTHETQGFLDRFNLPEVNSPTSCILVLLMAIVLKVYVVLLVSLL